jgi:hypothetical protein
MNKQLKCLLIIVSFVFIIVSCDLFTGPKVDLFRTISDEADWANAEKLTVRIDYPDAWGRSNPVQGLITNDIRKGFEFSVEFTTRDLYTLQSWQAYRTSDLDNLGNWLDFPELISYEQIQALGPNDVTLPAPVAAGGTFKFTIHTTEPVTLIPWCDNQPRIVRTEPRNNPDGAPYSIASNIVLYFNCAFNTDTAKFANAENADGIWITAKNSTGTFTNKDNDWFYEPEYAAVDGFFTVTISSRADNPPPSDSLITVTVKGVANERSGKKDKDGYSFSWNTKPEGESKRITVWNATNNSINSNKNQINIHANTNIKDEEWDSNDGKYYLKLYYRIDNGTRNLMLIGNKDVFTEKGWILRPEDYGIQYIGQINNVPVTNDRGMRDGMQISGIREYTIIIELYEGKIDVDPAGNATIVEEGIIENKVSFKIWNLPNMRVTSSNPAVEIRTAAELAAMNKNLGGQYVLANDIFVPDEWTPVGKYDASMPEAAFHGKFYGNGHTITLNKSVKANNHSVGLFGCVTNLNLNNSNYNRSSYSVIRDLNLIFDGEVHYSTALNFGGVAGTVYGNPIARTELAYGNGVEIRNIITGGAIKIGYNNAFEKKYLGGIAGYMEGIINVINCHAGMDIEILYDYGIEDIYIGGVAGCSYGTEFKIKENDEEITKNYIEVRDVICSGLIDAVSRDTWNNKPMRSNSLFIGGIIGEISGAVIRNTEKIGGLLITKNSVKHITAGGIVGSIKKGHDSDISNSYFRRGNNYRDHGITIIDKYSNTGSYEQHENIFAGGIVGNVDIESPNQLGISCCYSNTEILITGDFPNYDEYEDLKIGEKTTRIYIETRYPTKMSGSVNVGGFAGRLAVETGAYLYIQNCYALGDVKTFVTGSSSIYAGGFVGYMDMKWIIGENISKTASVYNTFTTVNIRAVEEVSQGAVYAGGIAGYRNSGILEKNVALNSNISAQGGSDSSRRAARVYCGQDVDDYDKEHGFCNYTNEYTTVGAASYDNRDTVKYPFYYKNDHDFNLQYLVGSALIEGVEKFNGESREYITYNGDQVVKNLIFFNKTDIWSFLGFGGSYSDWDVSVVPSYNHPKLKGLGGQ